MHHRNGVVFRPKNNDPAAARLPTEGSSEEGDEQSTAGERSPSISRLDQAAAHRTRRECANPAAVSETSQGTNWPGTRQSASALLSGRKATEISAASSGVRPAGALSLGVAPNFGRLAICRHCAIVHAATDTLALSRSRPRPDSVLCVGTQSQVKTSRPHRAHCAYCLGLGDLRPSRLPLAIGEEQVRIHLQTGRLAAPVGHIQMTCTCFRPRLGPGGAGASSRGLGLGRGDHPGHDSELLEVHESFRLPQLDSVVRVGPCTNTPDPDNQGGEVTGQRFGLRDSARPSPVRLSSQSRAGH